MDHRLLRLFLIGAAALALPATPTLADDSDIVEEAPVLDPAIVRLGLKEADIDSENLEVGGYLGYMSVENFGTDVVYGLRGAWHVTEDLFLEAQYGMTTAGRTSYEDLAPADLFADADRDLTYYNFSLGFNALPGEVFIGENNAFNTDIYLLAGAGTAEFAGDREFTINVGAGLRVIVLDWLAIHLMMQDLIFEKPAVIDPADSGDASHNLQYTTSVTVFF